MIPAGMTCIICPPTYGMYRVAADINDVAITEMPLTPIFSLMFRVFKRLSARRQN